MSVMTLTPSEFMPAMPEMVLLSMACVVLLADLFVREANRILTFLLAQVSLVMTFIAVLAVGHEGRLVAFYGTFVSDPMAQVLIDRDIQNVNYFFKRQGVETRSPEELKEWITGGTEELY